MTVNYADYLLDDFELRDDLQEVSITNSVTSVITTGVKAKSRNLNYREASLGGSLGYEPTDQVFMVGAKRLADAGLNRGDTITCADNSIWTIISDSINSFGDTPVLFEVVCRRQI